MSAPASRLHPGLSSLVFLVGLVLALWLGPRMVLEGWATSSWPTVEGEIFSADVERATTRGSGHHYVAKLRYRYTFEGQAYSGTRVHTAGSPSFNRGDEAAAFIANYPVGGAVQVFVNADDPAQAVLQHGIPWRGWGVLISGLVLVAITFRDVRRLLPHRQVD